MHFLYAGFVASSLSIVMALESVVDKPSYHHLLDDQTSVTKKLAVLETKDKLPNGMAYANAHSSPLLGKLVPGEIIRVAPITDQLGSEVSYGSSSWNPQREFAEQQLVTLYPNKTQQIFGFSSDIYKKIIKGKNGGPELSHAGISQPVETDELAKRKGILRPAVLKNTDHLTQRAIPWSEDRVEICNTWGYPYRTIGRLIVGHQSCTGILVSPRHVMTCGHCIYNQDSKAWVKPDSFSVSLRNGLCSEANYSVHFFQIKQLWTNIGWTTAGDWLSDWAIIELDITSTNLGWMSFGWDATHSPDNGDFNMNVLDRYNPQTTMWSTFAPFNTVLGPVYFTRMDTYDGIMGAPLYGYYADEDVRVIYGVLSGSGGLLSTSGTPMGNPVTRINVLRFRLICEIMHLSLPKKDWVC